MEISEDQLYSLLSSHNKLDRDKGLKHLSDQITDGIKDLAHIENKLKSLIEDTDKWESCHGGLLACKQLILHEPQSSQDFIHHVQSHCITLLQHNEARVRFAAGNIHDCL